LGDEEGGVITIGEKTFRTKELARVACQELLKKYRPGQVVNVVEDSMFLWALVQRHPRASEIIGIGINHFFVEADAFGGQHFSVSRVDGTRDHFSYLKCLRAPTIKEEVSKALRWEVISQILDFKNRSFGANSIVACALTGVSVSANSCHVDHYDPDFRVLRDQFMASKKLEFSDVRLADVENGGKRLADRHLALEWWSYHARIAKLRITSIQANLNRSRSED
jgi:hypothetical protein